MFIVENRDKILCNKKGTLLALLFIKIPYLGFFSKFSTKSVLCSLGYILNKVNRGIVQKPDEVGT